MIPRLMIAMALTLIPAAGTSDQPRLTEAAEEKQAVRCLPGDAASQTLEQRAMVLMGILVSEGLPPMVAAGIAGNASQESGIRPWAVASGAGMCQWAGSRRAGLARFASRMGRQWDDLEAQARWVAYELREGSESGAYAKIQKARTPEEAALLVSRHYERPRPSKANNRKRMSEARRFHLMMQGEGK